MLMNYKIWKHSQDKSNTLAILVMSYQYQIFENYSLKPFENTSATGHIRTCGFVDLIYEFEEIMEKSNFQFSWAIKNMFKIMWQNMYGSRHV